MNPRNFTATQAAILHSEYPAAYDSKPSSLPAMIWSTNYGRLASQTLFTLFFAGRDYAPKCIIDGVNIQDYLQSHFISAFGHLADRIKAAGDLLDECVIGWDSMNEPAEGFCGYENLNVVPNEQGSTLRKGSRPTPAQSLRLGMGQEQTVEHWAFGAFGPKQDGTVTIDPKGHKIWLDPEFEPDGYNARWGWRRDPGWTLGLCIWALHGVWDVESGYVIIPEYFRSPPFDPDRPVVFEADYWRPHWRAYVSRIRSAHPEAIHFIQPPVFAQPPPLDGPDDLKGRACYSGHYYDGLTLVTRHWNWFNADALGLLRGKYKATWMAAKLGEKAIRQSLQEQLGILKTDTEILGAFPTLIGEIGIPFDMDNKRAYGWTDGGKHTGDYSSQQKALDASLNAADGPNGLNYTIWTYCPDSCHEWGDGWNMEDLSLWSEDDLRNNRNRDNYRMRVADSSQAALLKGKSTPALVHQISSSPAPGVSAMSLDTLGGDSVAMTDDDEHVLDPKRNNQALSSLAAHPHWANQYDFLTDGARAVRAFARPFPVATVGVPSDIQFDISKAEFKLTVKVRPEDKPVNVEPSSSSSSYISRADPENKDDSNEELSEMPTEIYVPLVHYARQDIIQRSVAGYVQGDRETDPTSPEDRDPTSTPIDAGQVSSLSSAASSATLPTSSLVDIDVRVSAGRWAIEGQYLKWWYPVPNDDAPEVMHTIQIRRSGGVIKLTDDATANSSASPGSFWDLCETMCPKDTCCIM